MSEEHCEYCDIGFDSYLNYFAHKEQCKDRLTRLTDIEALIVHLAGQYPPPADVDAAVKRIRARLEKRIEETK